MVTGSGGVTYFFLLSDQFVITHPIQPLYQATHITHVAQTLILMWVIYTGHQTEEKTSSSTLYLFIKYTYTLSTGKEIDIYN